MSVSHWHRELADPLGHMSAPLSPDVTAIELEELPASQLSLRITCAAGPRPQLTTRLELLESSDPALASWLRSAELELEALDLAQGLAPSLTAGPQTFTLQPGRWRIMVSDGAAPREVLISQDVDLGPRPELVELALPTLYALDVVAPDLAPGVTLTLRRVSSGEREHVLRGSLIGSVEAAARRIEFDDDRRAHIEGLLPGPYELRLDHAHRPVQLVVPSGDVIFTSRRKDAFELRIAPLEGGGQGDFAVAGFSTGDVLLDFDGRELRDQDDLQALLDALLSRSVRIRVRRTEELLVIPLGPAVHLDEPWKTFDGDFVPTWR